MNEIEHPITSPLHDLMESLESAISGISMIADVTRPFKMIRAYVTSILVTSTIPIPFKSNVKRLFSVELELFIEIAIVVRESFVSLIGLPTIRF
jgi:hypothetical protein